ncbi:MAG: hypothetical protein Fues2KO_40370 [Fuerstiella sp.]
MRSAVKHSVVAFSMAAAAAGCQTALPVRLSFSSLFNNQPETDTVVRADDRLLQQQAEAPTALLAQTAAPAEKSAIAEVSRGVESPDVGAVVEDPTLAASATVTAATAEARSAKIQQVANRTSAPDRSESAEPIRSEPESAEKLSLTDRLKRTWSNIATRRKSAGDNPANDESPSIGNVDPPQPTKRSTTQRATVSENRLEKAGGLFAGRVPRNDRELHVISAYADDPAARHRVIPAKPTVPETAAKSPVTVAANVESGATNNATNETKSTDGESSVAQVGFQSEADEDVASNAEAMPLLLATKTTAQVSEPAAASEPVSTETSEAAAGEDGSTVDEDARPKRTISAAERDLMNGLNDLLQIQREPSAAPTSSANSDSADSAKTPSADATVRPAKSESSEVYIEDMAWRALPSRQSQQSEQTTPAVAGSRPSSTSASLVSFDRPSVKNSRSSNTKPVSPRQAEIKRAVHAADFPKQIDAPVRSTHRQVSGVRLASQTRSRKATINRTSPPASRSAAPKSTERQPAAVPPAGNSVRDGSVNEASQTSTRSKLTTISMASVGEPLAPVDATLINLPTALSMVGGDHPAVALARWRVQEAYAELDQAEVLWLPSLQAGFSFHRHDGNYQASNGAIVDVNRNSLQFGLGNGATGAGTTPRPGVQASFHLADAIFQPEIARRNAWAHGHAENAVVNRQLLEVALAYLGLLEATQRLRIVEQSRERVAQVADLTEGFAAAGQGLQADADRMQTELALIDARIVAAEEAVELASSALTHALSAPPGRPVVALDSAVVPLHLVPMDRDRDALIHTGLNGRPELKELQALVAAACEQHKRQQMAPFVPSVMLGLSAGGFGGGVGDSLNNVDERYDFDALVTWEVRNLGFGERAARRRSSAQLQQAMFRKVRRMDDVAREITDAHTQVLQRDRRMAVTERAIQSAENSFTRNLSRIRDGQGLPLEVLQSVQALEDATLAYADAVIAYNEAQFRLQWAMGWKVSGQTA